MTMGVGMSLTLLHFFGDPSPPKRLSYPVLFRFVSPFIVPFSVDDIGRPALFCGETGEKWIS